MEREGGRGGCLIKVDTLYLRVVEREGEKEDFLGKVYMSEGCKGARKRRSVAKR